MTDRSAFELVATAVQGDIAVAAAAATNDSAVRAMYQRTIAALMAEIRTEASMGRITWAEAARRAQEARNFAMEAMRGRSSPIGRALAESMKAQGKTLNELVARYTIRLFGPNANFNALSAAQQDLVYAEIVAAGARSNPAVNRSMLRLSRAGRGLIVLSIAVSVYNIATAEDPVRQTGREVAVTGGGILGGAAGGALAGLACGPGSPVCVTIGAFVGGALGAIGVDLFF
jgi:hypothetical protein